MVMVCKWRISECFDLIECEEFHGIPIETSLTYSDSYDCTIQIEKNTSGDDDPLLEVILIGYSSREGMRLCTYYSYRDDLIQYLSEFRLAYSGIECILLPPTQSVGFVEIEHLYTDDIFEEPFGPGARILGECY